MNSHSPLQACIRTLRYEAEGILSVELVPLPGVQWPAFTAGAHIDLHLQNGLIRSYSLLNSQDESNRYVLGILADSKSRGGSRYVHDHFRCGSTIHIGTPRNAFALDESACDIVLVAGGIGITPILSMYRRLLALNRQVSAAEAKRITLVYCARSRVQAAFADEIDSLSAAGTQGVARDGTSGRHGGSVHYHFDEEHGGKPFDLERFMARQSAQAHTYCCGPGVMLNAFETACEKAGITNVNVERFAANPVRSPTVRAGYEVELAKSGKTLMIEAGMNLLDAIIAAGVDVEHSCREGICGACETRVLSGCPDHLDSVLNSKEKASNKVMMICVSGAKDKKLVLDL